MLHGAGDLNAAFSALALAPDFAADKSAKLMFVHRHTADADIYFVDSRNAKAQSVAVTFRVTGRTPEIWRHAETGTSEPVSFKNNAMWGHDRAVPEARCRMTTLFVVFLANSATVQAFHGARAFS